MFYSIFLCVQNEMTVYSYIIYCTFVLMQNSKTHTVTTPNVKRLKNSTSEEKKTETI